MSAPDSAVRKEVNRVFAGATASRHDSGRAMRLVALGIAITALLFVYRDTFGSLVAIWNRSDTFAHGYLVAPISVWLIWRDRHQLREVPFRTSVLGLGAVMLAGFGWLVGELASVASVSQFAVVGLVVGSVWAILGSAAAKQMAFPLGFLFFLVPFGEFLFPSMMDRTSDFVVWGLRISGVPVYAEGHSIVVPSGHWEVVEGCSGVRYLIASVVVGCLYAFLTYRSLVKRVLFVGVSIVLPVIANWLRAYGIVLLAHLTDNRVAAGVDHVIYGWVFFGAIMILLFWGGARWREDLPDERGNAGYAPPAAPRGEIPSLRGAVSAGAVLLLALMWSPLLAALDARAAAGPLNLVGLPAHPAWQPAAAGSLPEWRPHFSGMRGEVREAWVRDTAPVGLYVAYYRAQQPGQELVNSENRVLKYKDREWTMTADDVREAKIGGGATSVLSTEIANPLAGRLLVWHWYWVDGRWTTSDYVAKLYQTVAQLRGHGDDSAAVMVYTPVGEGGREAASSVLGAFLHDRGNELAMMLDHAGTR